MQLLTAKEVKEIAFRILLLFDQYCRQNGLVYYLCGGTLLGAIRHKGFIPWDDDIDVCMPRPDYEKFLQGSPSFFEQYNLRVQDGTNKEVQGSFAFCKILDLSTEIERQYSRYHHHLWIDVFPVDGLPDDIDEVKWIYRKCKIYRTIIRWTGAVPGRGKTLLRKYIKYILRPLAELYGAQRSVAQIVRIARQYPYETSTYVGIVSNGMYGENERMLKSEFIEPVQVEFCRHAFPAFACWDSYLHNLYGNYMQLPPENCRFAHDMQVFKK